MKFNFKIKINKLLKKLIFWKIKSCYLKVELWNNEKKENLNKRVENERENAREGRRVKVGERGEGGVGVTWGTWRSSHGGWGTTRGPIIALVCVAFVSPSSDIPLVHNHWILFPFFSRAHFIPSLSLSSPPSSTQLFSFFLLLLFPIYLSITIPTSNLFTTFNSISSPFYYFLIIDILPYTHTYIYMFYYSHYV